MSDLLKRLLAPPTKEELFEKQLKHLKGVGWVRHTVGFSPGLIDCDGTPTADYDVVIRIVTTGGLGVGEFQYSTDAGETFSVTLPIEEAGIYVMPGTGCTLTFDDDGETLTGFRATDEYRVFLRQNGFPVTDWQPLSVPRTLVENDVEALQALFDLVKFLGYGGFISLAAQNQLEPWVDLAAEQQYGTSRRAGVATKGTVELTDAQGQGPFTLAPGELIVATGGGLQYRNTEAFTLELDAVDFGVEVQAELVGIAYNAPNNTIVVMVSTQAGVTVNNPDPGTGTWVTRGGTDQETSIQLAQRCVAMLPGLGYGVPSPNYDTWAKAASDTVTKTTTAVAVGTPGQLALWLAGSAGGVTPEVVALVQAYVNPRAPQCVDVAVASASSQTVNVTGVANVYAGFESQAQAATQANLAALIADCPIGGTLYFSQVLDAIQRVPGMRNVVLTSPVADTVLAAATVASLNNALTFNTV